MFEQKDAGFHPKSYEWTELRNSLDGSDCPSPTTRDGMVLGEGPRAGKARGRGRRDPEERQHGRQLRLMGASV